MEGPIFHCTMIVGKESSTFQVRSLLPRPIYRVVRELCLPWKLLEVFLDSMILKATSYRLHIKDSIAPQPLSMQFYAHIFYIQVLPTWLTTIKEIDVLILFSGPKHLQHSSGLRSSWKTHPRRQALVLLKRKTTSKEKNHR